MIENYTTSQVESPDRRMLDNPDRTPEANERLQVLDAVMRDYQSEHSFVEGATVFGSTMHGGAHEKSDIDAFVFIDPDVVSEQLGGEQLDAFDYNEMARVVEHDLMSKIGKQVGEQSSGRRNDIQIVPLNDEIIDTSVAKYESQSKIYEDHSESMRALRDEYYSRPVEPIEDFETYAQQIKGIDIHSDPEIAMMEWGVSALFHPAVGDNQAIARLRNKVLDRFSASPVGSELWADIVSRIETFEGDMHYDESKFPQTLAEARQAFESFS